MIAESVAGAKWLGSPGRTAVTCSVIPGRLRECCWAAAGGPLPPRALPPSLSCPRELCTNTRRLYVSP